MKLIDKDALVAEINRLRKKNDIYDKPSHIADVCYKEILSLIDSLEVKEVNIEEEVESLIKSSIWRFADKEDFLRVAKHSFNLGLRASNPLTWEDVRDIMELYDEVTSMDYCNDIYEEVLKRFKEKRINYGTTRSDRPCKE